MTEYWNLNAYLRLPPKRAVVGLEAFFGTREAHVMFLNTLLRSLVVVKP